MSGAAHGAEPHILIVDDVEDNRNILSRRLQRLGYRQLSEAADGLAALALVRAAPVDLVLLDVMMPGMNGLEVLGVLRSEGRLESTPVVMISASTEVDTVVQCLDLGAEDYLPKPFNPSVLRARIGSVLEKKRLRAEVRRQLDRLEAELETARHQQLAMVNTDFPPPGGPVDLHAVMRPAQEVGGDLYDFFEVAPGELCIALGDVSGKGMPAALFMARARSLLRAGVLQFRALTGRTPRPSEAAALLNEELAKNNGGCLFLTLLVGIVSVAARRVDFVNAGHLRPLQLGPGGVVEVAHAADLPLGVVEDASFVDHTLTLGADDALVLVTDGLLEMENAQHEMYTAERLRAECAGAEPAAGARAIADRLVSAVFGHAAGTPQFDDVTLLVLRLPAKD